MDLNQLINSYIERCNNVIENRDYTGAEELEYEIIAAFESIIPKIYTGLHAYSYGGDYIKDIVSLRAKLEVLKVLEGDYKRFNPKASNFSINNTSSIDSSGNSTNTNTQNQTVNNTFDIKLELDKVRREIEEDEVLDDVAKEELNEKLNEIEEVINEEPSNNEKWKKLKSTFTWITTKSYKVGKWIMPIIIKALFPEE